MREELFDELRESLSEAILHAQGKLELKNTVLPAAPSELTKEEIAGIRKRLNCSQGVFARALNVSVKTVQAWESGARKPSDAALKLLSIARRKPEVLFEFA